MDVTIYSKPNCPQCEATKRKFTKEGVAFREVDVTEDRRAFMRVRDEWGYQRVPVIEVRGEGFDVRWDGFRPDRMKAVIDEFNRLVALSVEAGDDVDEEEVRIAALVDGIVESLVNASEPHQYGFVDDSAQLSDEQINILLSGVNPYDAPAFNWIWESEEFKREREVESLVEQAGVGVDALTEGQLELIGTALMDNGEYVHFDDLTRHAGATLLRMPVQGFPGRSLEDIYDDIKDASDVNASASNGLVERTEGRDEFLFAALSEYLASAGIDVELNNDAVAKLIERSALSGVGEGVYLDVVWHGKFQEFIPDYFHAKTVTFTDPHVALGNSRTGHFGGVRLKGTMSMKIESQMTLKRCGYPGDWHVRTDKGVPERARVERFIGAADELELRRAKPVVEVKERDAQRFVTMLEQGAGTSRPSSFHQASAHLSGFKVTQSARGQARGR
ncbi:glutaredoxin family protein [Pauljensenia sp. UMB0895]|uniref:glutaredoxin family protein n=1 Tax=Pauljensenia sp. UMB0895 TaxID=3046319 RepID=UPI00255043FD|nr:glutaredoxin family protein [Pauljensenia sp. UMB0895]MDK7338688.1 glutaredoxin family protein [Pauljensenia sp. UMB0895]